MRPPWPGVQSRSQISLTLRKFYSAMRYRGVDTHAIETDDASGYQRRFLGQHGDTIRIIAGFPTWRSASDWLDEHVRIMGGDGVGQDDV